MSRWSVGVLALGLVLASCAPRAPTQKPADAGPAGPSAASDAAAGDSAAIDLFELGIEIGRYNYMLDQTDDLSKTLWPEPALGAAELSPEQERQRLMAQLRETALQLASQRTKLCLRGALVESTCAGAFLPAWLSEDPRVIPDEAKLKARADELGTHAMSFWETVCGQAKPDADGMPPCPIE